MLYIVRHIPIELIEGDTAADVHVKAGNRVLVYWPGNNDWIAATVLEVGGDYAVLRYALLHDRLERVPAASFVRHGNVLLIKGSDDDDAVPSASDIDQILQHAVPAPETTQRQQKKGDTAVDDGATLDWLGNAEHLYKLQPSSSRGGGGLDGLSLDSAPPKGRNNVIPAAMPAMPTAPQKIGVWWPNYNKVYPADVVKVHANGSCLVQYHDGTLETIAEEWRFVAAGIT